MSSQESLDQTIVEQTKQQIRTIVGEIAQLSKLDITPDEYHGEFLHRVVSAMGALGGAVWTFEEGALNLAYQVNIKELGLRNETDSQSHARLLYRMLHGPESGTLVPPHSGIEGDEQSGNPTDHLLVFCPIRTELEVVGLIEIIQRHETTPDMQRGFLRFLAQVCLLATDFYKNRQLRYFGERQNLWTLLEEFTRTIHQSLNVQETTYTIANEGRKLIECDRVSIALRRGNRCKIVAVSGQDVVDKRATTVRLLGRLATAVVRAGEPVWYTGDTSNFAPQVEKTIDRYVDEAQTKMIAVFPLVAKKRRDGEEEDDPTRRTKPERPFGAILVEQIEDSRVPERMRKRVEIVAEHACSALGNALEHHSIFLLPFWKLIGKSKLLFTARTLPKTVLATALALGLVLSMIFVTWNFSPHCTGVLEPIRRQNVFSPLDAEIKQLFVDHDTPVQGPSQGEDGIDYRGTTLLELRSTEMESTGMQLLGKQQELLEQITSLKRQLLDQEKRLTEYERGQLVGQQRAAEIQLKTNENQLRIYRRQTEDLFVTSPIDGVVVSWDLKRRLNDKRPVSRMQFLMEIADLSGPWQLELSMPEKRMGSLIEHLNHLRRSDPEARLRVEFFMADSPNVKHFGTIAEIHDRAEVRSDTGSAATSSTGLNTVLIKVALDDRESLPPSLRPGVECSAKVDCGKKPLGYVLFYEVIAFVQKNILFRLF